jgi:hypothetical protein
MPAMSYLRLHNVAKSVIRREVCVSAGNVPALAIVMPVDAAADVPPLALALLLVLSRAGTD